MNNGAVPSLIAERLWLLGQDPQYLRPRVSRLRVAATAAALLDVIATGSAGWGENGATVVGHPAVHVSAAPVAQWADRVTRATAAGPLRTVHAIDSLAPGVWDQVGRHLLETGLATPVRHSVRRWLPPRGKPDQQRVDEIRTRLRAAPDTADAPIDPVDHGVLVVGYAAAVLDTVLSESAFPDPTVMDTARPRMQDDPIVRSLTDAIGLLASAEFTGQGAAPTW